MPWQPPNIGSRVNREVHARLLRPVKTGVFSRRQTCQGKSQKPCSLDGRIAGNQNPNVLKPIDKVSLGEITSHRAVTIVNANVASKVRRSEGRARNCGAKATWDAEI
jgi:hypothetical protein